MLLQDSPDEQELFQAMGRVVNSLLLEGDQSESDEPSSSSDTPRDNSECDLQPSEEQSLNETQSGNTEHQYESRDSVETNTDRALGESRTHSGPDQGEQTRQDDDGLQSKSNADEDEVVHRQGGPLESQQKLEVKREDNGTVNGNSELGGQQMERTVPQETVRPVPPAGEDTDSPASAVSIETGVVELQHADDTKRPGLYGEDVDSCTTGGELVVT